VFATFETEEGLNRAITYNDAANPQMKFLGEDLIIQQASEPTDIIWENRHFEPRTRTCKRVVVWTVIFGMLAVSAALIFKFTLISNSAKFRYPAAQCSTTADEYAKRITRTGNKKIWEYDAVMEHKVNYDGLVLKPVTHFTDVLQCFCNERAQAK